MLHLRLRGKLVRIGCEKGERPFRRFLVLRQMKRHPANEMQQGMNVVQITDVALRMSRRLLHDVGAQFRSEVQG